jgi:hypothetical protein
MACQVGNPLPKKTAVININRSWEDISHRQNEFVAPWSQPDAHASQAAHISMPPSPKLKTNLKSKQKTRDRKNILNNYSQQKESMSKMTGIYVGSTTHAFVNS